MKLQKIAKTPEGTAAIAAFVCGFFTHLYALVNTIHNYDDICMLPYGFGTGTSLGRWFLEVLGYFSGRNGGDFNLPVINGLLFLLILSVTAGFLVSVFRMQNRGSAALMGMLFVVFPTVTSTMLFRYTVIYNGIAVFLAVAAVWVLRKNRFGLLLSSFCICLSMGIYQAYVPITIGIFVLLLIQEALKGNSGVKELVCRGLYDCAALLLGLLLYFICMKAVLALSHTALSYYQGTINMGQISLSGLPGLVKKAFVTFLTFPQTNYCGLAGIALIRFSYLCLGLLSVGMIVSLLIVKVKKPGTILVTCLLCLVFPVAVGFIEIMCPEANVYTMMVYSFVLAGCAPLVLADCLPLMEGVWKKCRFVLTKGTVFFAVLLIFCYAYYDNVNYSSAYYADRQVENYLSGMVVQIRMTEGFDAEKKWAFIGDIQDPLLDSLWSQEKKYGGNVSAEVLLNAYSRMSWIENYVGYTVPQASSEEIAALAQSEEVQSMPCWPSQGSIKVIGDTVVIKCQELSDAS